MDDAVFTKYKDLPEESKELLREAYKKDVLNYFKPKQLPPAQAALIYFKKDKI